MYEDWYENNETGDYKWFDGSGAQDGYTWKSEGGFNDGDLFYARDGKVYDDSPKGEGRVVAPEKNIGEVVLTGKKGSSDINVLSTTVTTNETLEMPVINLITGDKVSINESKSQTFGNANGILNLDISFNNESYDGFSLSSKLGNSISFKSDGTIEFVQKIGGYELHGGKGPGIGLGQYNIGFKEDTGKNQSSGKDIVVRNGFGSLAAAAVVRVIFAPEITIPAIGTAARALAH